MRILSLGPSFLRARLSSTEAPQIIEHVHKSLNYTPYETLWVPCSARFISCGITTRAKGIIQVYELSHGAVECVLEREKGGGIKCGTFGHSDFDNRTVALGDYGGVLNIWDLERMDVPVYSAQAHSSIVNAIDGIGGLGIGGGAPELVTGSRDGCVRVWDPRVPEPVVSLEPAEGQAVRDCWTVAFGNSFGDERCVAAGYDNGDLKIFDLRANAMRWETNLGNGITSVQFDRKDVEMNKCVVTTLESRFRIFDLRTQHAEEGFASVTERAHKATVWLSRHTPQNRDLWMTGGGNGGFNLYKYNYPKVRVRARGGPPFPLRRPRARPSSRSPRSVLRRQSRSQTGKDNQPIGVAGSAELLNSRVISTQPIVSFDWSPDREGLCVLSCLDQTLRVYICTKLNKI